MNKFFVHQQVVIGPGAMNSVGCQGRVVNVRDATCDVFVETPRGNYVGEFRKQDLIVEGRGPMNPESAINHCLSKLLREARQPVAVIPDAGVQQGAW